MSNANTTTRRRTATATATATGTDRLSSLAVRAASKESEFLSSVRALNGAIADASKMYRKQASLSRRVTAAALGVAPTIIMLMECPELYPGNTGARSYSKRVNLLNRLRDYANQVIALRNNFRASIDAVATA